MAMAMHWGRCEGPVEIVQLSGKPMVVTEKSASDFGRLLLGHASFARTTMLKPVQPVQYELNYYK